MLLIAGLLALIIAALVRSAWQPRRCGSPRHRSDRVRVGSWLWGAVAALLFLGLLGSVIPRFRTFAIG